MWGCDAAVGGMPLWEYPSAMQPRRTRPDLDARGRDDIAPGRAENHDIGVVGQSRRTFFESGS